MTKPSLISIVPVTHPYNSIYLQAKMMHDALAPWYDTSPGLTVAQRRVAADITLVHYGSLDRFAWRLAATRGAVFVFHGITPPHEFLPWNPLVALRGLLGYCQLRTFPKKLEWIALSGYSADTLRANGLHRVEEARCIVPTRQPDLDSAEGERSAMLLFVGRISPNKRVLELLDVFECLHDQFPAVTLRIVGAAGKRCWYGRAFVRRLRLSRARKNIVWQPDPIRLSELQTLYRQAFVYVSCSTHEGFGVPVLEAISFRTPAIYAACGGTESVLNGIGQFRTQGSCERAAEIAGFIGEPGKRNELLALQRAALPRFSRESVGQMLERAISKTVSLASGE